MSRADELRHGLAWLGLALTTAQERQLLEFAELLERWNRVFNLISRRDVSRIVARHLLDALAMAAHLHGGRIADLGSGAGLPGIPLAIAEPERDFTLIDRSERRSRFMQQAVIELGLANVAPIRASLESYRPAGRFDSVVSRAVAGPERIWRSALPLLSGGGARALLQCGPDAAAARFPGAASSRFLEMPLPGLKQAHGLWIVQAPTPCESDGGNRAP